MENSERGRSRQRKKKSRKKMLLWTLSILVLALISVVGAAYAVFKVGYYGKSNYVESSGYTLAEITEELETLPEDKEEELLAAHNAALAKFDDVTDGMTGTYNLLLIGVDRRDKTWDGNSDVMILITVNHDRDTIYMTSFLRDLYAYVPGVGIRKMNASCAFGGAELCVETVRSNYGVQIDNYAMVDFEAMIDIVDALGGIDLELSDAEAKAANGAISEMCRLYGGVYEDHALSSGGLLHLDGYQAVAFARDRHTGLNHDFGRTERQRKVLKAIFEKAKSGGLGSLNTAAQTVLPYVTHDISESTVLGLLWQLPGWLNYEIVEQHIPYDGMYYIDHEILIPDMEETIQKIRDTIY